MNSLWTTKLSSMAILGLSALVCIGVPIIALKKFGLSEIGGPGTRWIGIFMRFGGGILIATTFLHMLPEVRETVEYLIETNYLSKSLPIQLPELIMCLGFFTMYAVEEGVHRLLFRFHSSSRLPEEGISQASGSLKERRHSHIVTETPLRTLLITVAISVHQLFEGLAIGLEDTSAQTWILTAAVAAHKLVIAICVGAEIATAKSSKIFQISCVVTFVIATPIGTLMGAILVGRERNDLVLKLVSMILQGLATGSLLYVVCFEILQRTEHTEESGLIQFIATFLGFVVMVTIFWTIHE